jgi:hypothetical protein
VTRARASRITTPAGPPPDLLYLEPLPAPSPAKKAAKKAAGDALRPLPLTMKHASNFVLLRPCFRPTQIPRYCMQLQDPAGAETSRLAYTAPVPTRLARGRTCCFCLSSRDDYDLLLLLRSSSSQQPQQQQEEQGYMGAEGSTLAGAEAALVDGEHNRSRQLARRCRLLASAWATRPSALLACLLLASEVFRRSDERMVEFSIAFPVVSGAAIACSATVATVPGHLSKPRSRIHDAAKKCQNATAFRLKLATTSPFRTSCTVRRAHGSVWDSL